MTYRILISHNISITMVKDLINWSDGQAAISKVKDAHRQLVEKGLVLETQPVSSK